MYDGISYNPVKVKVKVTKPWKFNTHTILDFIKDIGFYNRIQLVYLILNCSSFILSV